MCRSGGCVYSDIHALELVNVYRDSLSNTLKAEILDDDIGV